MYKVIGYVIYSFIRNLICLDYMGIIQHKLSDYDNNSEKAKFNDFSGLGIPKIMMNIMSCHGFHHLQHQQLFLHVAVLV